MFLFCCFLFWGVGFEQRLAGLFGVDGVMLGWEWLLVKASQAALRPESSMGRVLGRVFLFEATLLDLFTPFRG